MFILVDEVEQDKIEESFKVDMVILLHNRRSVFLGYSKSNQWEMNMLEHFDENRFCQVR